MQLVFKNKTKLGSDFPFRDWISKDLISSVVCKFHCGFKKSYYGECVIHLNVTIGKNISSSLLTKNQVKPNSSSVADHLLFCNHLVSYDDFSMLMRENKKFLLELKESLLLRRYKSSLLRIDK